MATELRYCKNSTITHKVAQAFSICIADMDSLIAREGFSGPFPFFTQGEVVLDMDLAEAKVAAQQQRVEKNKSMDMAYVIRSSDNKKIASVIVELKFNMRDFYCLKKEQLEQKVQGSAAILSDVPPLYNRFYFVVQTNYIQEATSRLFRMIPEIDKRFVAIDLPSLKHLYF